MSLNELNLIDFDNESYSKAQNINTTTASFPSNIQDGMKIDLRENLLIDIPNQDNMIKDNTSDFFQEAFKPCEMQEYCEENNRNVNSHDLLCLWDDGQTTQNEHYSSSILKTGSAEKILNSEVDCSIEEICDKNIVKQNDERLDNPKNLNSFMNQSTVNKEENESLSVSYSGNSKPLQCFESLNCLNDSYEDLTSITPNWVDLELDADSDLENLKIPILDKLDLEINSNSPICEDTIDLLSNATAELLARKNITDEENQDENMKQISNSFAALKEKLRLQKHNTDKNDLTKLITNLKQIILNCSHEEKKKSATNLLESLETLLNSSGKISPSQDDTINYDEISAPTIQIVNQGITDSENKEISITENQQNDEINDSKSSNNSQSNNIVIMKSPPQAIVEQIDKILSEQNILSHFSDRTSNGKNNSTYIFVMKTPKRLTRQATEIFDMKRLTRDNEDEDGIPYRRRSLSLNSSPRNKLVTAKITEEFKTPKGPASQISNTRKSMNIFKTIQSERKLIQKKDDVGVSLKPKSFLRRSINVITHSDKTDENNKNVLNLQPNKLRVKSNETNTRTQGPLKATIPIIKVAPMFVNNDSSSINQSESSTENNQNLRPPKSTTVIQGSEKQKKTTQLSSNSSKRVSSIGSSSTTTKSSSSSANTSQSHITRRSYLSIPSNSGFNSKNRRSLTNMNGKSESTSNNNSVNVINKTQRKSQDFLKTGSKLTPVKMGTQSLKRNN